MPEPGRFCNGPPASFRGNPRNSLRDSAGSAAGSARQAGRRLEKRTGSASKRRNRSCPCRAQPCAPAPPRRRRTTSKRFGCRSPPTAHFKAAAAPDRAAPRTCIITRRKAGRSSTRRRACGAAMPGTDRQRDRRGDPGTGGRARFRAHLSIRPSEAHSSWPRSSPNLRPAISTTSSSRNSGSEAVDTALKIALAYQRASGEGCAPAADRPRARLSRRRLRRHLRRRHGQEPQILRLAAGRRRPSAAHARSEHQAFSRGQPDHGAELADELERIVALHDASTIAAVIVEPVAGSTGVLPPPKGYLQRLRAICDKHGILLIFDEVITALRTAWTRVRARSASASCPT